jgi:hypothetical protein
MNIALDAVPPGIDPAGVHSYLAALPGVTEVHDLHIWAMSTTETALTVAIANAGNVGSWPISEVAPRLIEIRSVGHSGLDLLVEFFAFWHTCEVRNVRFRAAGTQQFAGAPPLTLGRSASDKSPALPAAERCLAFKQRCFAVSEIDSRQ